MRFHIDPPNRTFVPFMHVYLYEYVHDTRAHAYAHSQLMNFGVSMASGLTKCTLCFVGLLRTDDRLQLD